MNEKNCVLFCILDEHDSISAYVSSAWLGVSVNLLHTRFVNDALLFKEEKTTLQLINYIASTYCVLSLKSAQVFVNENDVKKIIKNRLKLSEIKPFNEACVGVEYILSSSYNRGLFYSSLLKNGTTGLEKKFFTIRDTIGYSDYRYCYPCEVFYEMNKWRVPLC